MNKQELIKAVQTTIKNNGFEFTQDEVNVAISALSEVVNNTVLSGDKVKIPGVGTFASKDTKARMAHNPKDVSQKFEVPASKKVTFKVDAGFKEAVKA